MQVNLIPESMKNRILETSKYLTKHEIQRLKIELFKPYEQKEVDRFHSFIKIMDKTRGVSIENFLPEWKGIIYKDGRLI